MIKNKYGQLWVETVIYTLIAFVLISAVLAIAQPQIAEIQDKTYLEQSISMIKDINDIFISITQGGTGNKRQIEIGINKGELKVDAENDMLIFEMEGSYLYSEPGEDISEGDIIIHTREKGDEFVVNMSRDYSDIYNITYHGKDDIKIFSKSTASYKLYITNKGRDSSNKIIIDFETG